MSEFEPHEERDLLAAEYVLGLLPADELLAARNMAAADGEFAALVEAWERRFAPLYDGFGAVEPDAAAWARIERAIDAERPGGAEILNMRRGERWWKGYAAAMTAVAASLALVLGFQTIGGDGPVPAPAPSEQRPQAALVASMASEDGGAALAVAFDPETRSMIVTPARLTGAAGHDHELWLIPAGGAPVSLGLVRGVVPARLRVPDAFVGAVGPQASIALSVEPVGGSPTGQPTGPVIASGALTRI
jgi:anti-sigma-K factor RskA